MHVKNTLTEYGLISKSLHWLSAILLFIQIPLGFYLVDLDYGIDRITIEDTHVLIGLSIFYIVILRLIYKIFNPTPKLEPSVFKGQRFLAKLNHVMLYVTILSITISGILKKLFNGETLTIIHLVPPGRGRRLTHQSSFGSVLPARTGPSCRWTSS